MTPAAGLVVTSRHRHAPVTLGPSAEAVTLSVTPVTVSALSQVRPSRPPSRSVTRRPPSRSWGGLIPPRAWETSLRRLALGLRGNIPGQGLLILSRSASGASGGGFAGGRAPLRGGKSAPPPQGSCRRDGGPDRSVLCRTRARRCAGSRSSSSGSTRRSTSSPSRNGEEARLRFVGGRMWPGEEDARRQAALSEPCWPACGLQAPRSGSLTPGSSPRSPDPSCSPLRRRGLIRSHPGGRGLSAPPPEPPTLTPPVPRASGRLWARGHPSTAGRTPGAR